MSKIQSLQYIGRNGTRCAVGGRNDDPYLGNPKSDRALQLMQEGPIGIGWLFGGGVVERRFDNRVQAALDPSETLVAVIGHWGAAIDGQSGPNNGVVLNADGSVRHRIAAPAAIKDAQCAAAPLVEGLSVIKRIAEGLEIWISFDEGEWHEKRLYDPLTGNWGRVTGQYRAV